MIEPRPLCQHNGTFDPFGRCNGCGKMVSYDALQWSALGIDPDATIGRSYPASKRIRLDSLLPGELGALRNARQRADREMLAEVEVQSEKWNG